MTPKEGEYVLKLLRSRNGSLSFVVLDDGEIVRVFNVAESLRDYGEDYHEINANVSPSVDSEPVRIFSTSEVRRIDDENGSPLFHASNSN